MDWHSPGRCPPAASSSRPEGSSGLGGSSKVGVPGTDLLVMKGRRGAGSKKMCRGTCASCPPIGSGSQVAQVEPSPDWWSGRGDARAVRNHEWPKEVNSNLAESTDGNLSGLFLASTTLSLGKLGCWVRFYPMPSEMMNFRVEKLFLLGIDKNMKIVQ